MTSIPIVAATRHAAMRVRERHGAQPDAEMWRLALLDITDTVLGIRTGAMRLRLKSDGREIWAVRLDGVCRSVVYDPATATIITVLS